MTRLSRPHRSSDAPYPGQVWRAAFLGAAAIIGVIAAPSASSAQGFNSWTGAVSSDWFTTGNWSAGVPISSDFVIIDINNIATIAAPGAVAGTLTVGNNANGTLLIQGGGDLFVNGFSAIVANSPGSSGTVIVTGAGSALKMDQLTHFYIGAAGTGMLLVSNGGKVDSSLSASTNLVVGAATVTGPNSTWDTAGLQLGRSGGTGTLTVSDGGTVSGSLSVGSGSIVNIGAASHQSPVAPGILTGQYLGLAGGAIAEFNHTSSNYVFGTIISGAGSVVFDAGTTVLTGTNTYTGGTTIKGGTVSVAADTNLGGAAGALTINGGTLRVSGTAFTTTARTLNWGGNGGSFDIADAANRFTVNQTLGSSGQLTKLGAGTLVLTAANSQAQTTLLAGTVSVGAEANLGAAGGRLFFNGGTLQVTGTTFTTTARPISWDVNGGGFDIADANNIFTVNQAIVSGGVLTKAGAGTLVLTANNDYAGTTIAAGTLQLGNGGTTGAITRNVANNGVLALNRSNAYQFDGVISGTGAIQQNGLGITTLTATNTFSGGTTITAGTLQLGNGGTTGSISGNVTDNGTLAFNRSNGYQFDGVISGSGAVQQNGTGTTVLTADSAYGGGTTITAGTLQLGNGGTTGSITGNVADNATLAFNRSDHYAFGGAIFGSGAVQQNGAGTTTLTATNNYTGGTIFNAGTLSVATNANLGNSTGALTFNGGVLQVTGTTFISTTRTINWGANGGGFDIANAFNSFTVNQALGSGGALTKLGAGSLVLTAANTYVGGTTIAAGTLQLGNGGTTGSIAGDVINNGILAFNRANAYQFDGAISGTGAVQQNRGGVISLTAANTYSGGTLILLGTLQLGNGGTSGSIVGDVTNDATLAFNRSNAYQFNGAISGTGMLQQNGTGVTSLTAANTYGGGTTIAAGTLQLGDGGTTGSIIGNVLDNAALAFNRTNAYQFDGAISGTGALQQNGAGVTTLTAANTYGGGTTIAAGTLQLGNGGTTGSIIGNVLDNATLAFNRANAYQFDGLISGTGALLQNGAGVTALTAANTYGGGTTIAAGMLQLGNGGTTGSITGNVTDNATLAFNRSNAYQFDGVISGSGAVRQIGSGTTVLTGNNAYTGGTTIATGILQLGNGGASGSIVGNVLDNGIFAVNRSDSLTLAGQISGTGVFQQLGTGTTILTNASSYSGGTTIAGGTLRVENNAALGSGAVTTTGSVLDYANGITLANPIQINSNHTQLQVVAGSATQAGIISELNGPRPLEKIGAGSLVLNAVNTYTGTTTVSGGILDVMGSVAASSLTSVSANAMLTGTGTVGNTTIASGGAFAPGNGTPGSSIMVSGNLALQSGALYLVQVNSAAASFADVSGHATLNGTVSATYASGTNLAKRYTLLSAAGGISGSFGTLANTNLSSVTTSLSYDATHAYLDLSLNFTPTGPGAGTGLTGNQQTVANVLTGYFNTNGGIAMEFGALTPAGLTQVTGEAATGTQQTTFQAMNLFMGVMLDPWLDGRDGNTPQGSASQFAEDKDTHAAAAYASTGRMSSRSERDAYAAVYTKAPPRIADPFASRWNVWAAGFGGSQTTSGNATLGSNTATGQVYGMAVGADYRLSPDTLAGFALAGGGTNFGIANALGGGSSDLFQAGAFIRHSTGAAYLSAALAYGWQDITTDRTVTAAGVDHLRARFNANAFSGRIEGGYRFATSWIGVTPYAAAQVTAFDLPAYAEGVLSGSDIFALNYASKAVTATRSELGWRTDKSYAVGEAALVLRSRLAWAHDFNPDRSIAASFQTLPGASFVVNGAAQARDAALTTASAEMKFINGISLAATFEGEFSNVTRSYAGKGVARYQW
jgi:fibronectin-binding autotransporter adhesin